MPPNRGRGLQTFTDRHLTLIWWHLSIPQTFDLVTPASLQKQISFYRIFTRSSSTVI